MKNITFLFLMCLFFKFSAATISDVSKASAQYPNYNINPGAYGAGAGLQFPWVDSIKNMGTPTKVGELINVMEDGKNRVGAFSGGMWFWKKIVYLSPEDSTTSYVTPTMMNSMAAGMGTRITADSNRVNTRVKYIDTGAMLINYATKAKEAADSSMFMSNISGKVNNSDTTNRWYPKSANPAGYLTSVPAQSFASLTGKPVTLSGYGISDAYPLSGNPSNFLTSVPAQTWASITSKPTTILGYGITDGVKYTDTASMLLPYAKTASTLTIPTANTVTRSITGTTYTISSTKAAWVSYSVAIQCTATIGSASSGSVLLQYSTNAGSSWIDVCEIKNSNTVTLAVVLNSVTIQQSPLAGFIPAGALVRMTQTTAGTTSISFVKGQEAY